MITGFHLENCQEGTKLTVISLLTADTKEDCEKRVEALLYKLPRRQVTLDRFMYEYEKVHGERLSHYYGHSKLSSLLERMSNIVVQEVCV